MENWSEKEEEEGEAGALSSSTTVASDRAAGGMTGQEGTSRAQSTNRHTEEGGTVTHRTELEFILLCTAAADHDGRPRDSGQRSDDWQVEAGACRCYLLLTCARRVAGA